MSSSAAPGSAAPSYENVALALYNWCRGTSTDEDDTQQDRGDSFTQEQLLHAGIVPSDDGDLLMKCINVLISRRLFRPADTHDGKLTFQIVTQENAEKYASRRGT